MRIQVSELTKNQWSRFRYQESVIKNQGASAEFQVSSIKNQVSGILYQGSRINVQGSRSKIRQQEFGIGIKDKRPKPISRDQESITKDPGPRIMEQRIRGKNQVIQNVQNSEFESRGSRVRI